MTEAVDPVARWLAVAAVGLTVVHGIWAFFRWRLEAAKLDVVLETRPRRGAVRASVVQALIRCRPRGRAVHGITAVIGVERRRSKRAPWRRNLLVLDRVPEVGHPHKRSLEPTDQTSVWWQITDVRRVTIEALWKERFGRDPTHEEAVTTGGYDKVVRLRAIAVRGDGRRFRSNVVRLDL